MRLFPGVFWTALAMCLAFRWLLGPAQSDGLVEPIHINGNGLAPAIAQAEDPLPEGLPPAPTYLPGTPISSGSPQRNKASAQAGSSPHAAEGSQDAAPTAPAPVPILTSSSATPDLQGAGPVWQKVIPLLPAPGTFAIIRGSELRPVLVRKGEFDFCDQIKCDHSGAVLGAWNGGAFDAERGEFRVHGGGHADYGGNEVYAFDFSTLQWTRETDPQPLTGPFMRDSDRNGVAEACPAPAAGPPATHTYQGFLYVPKIDRYWLFGTVGYCQAGMGAAVAWEYDANKKAWAPMPELDQFAKFARAIIDRNSGDVLIHGGRGTGWHEIDPTTRRIVRSFGNDPFGSYSDGPAVLDQKRGMIFALIGGKNTDRLVAYDWPALGSSSGIGGRVIAEWPKEGRKAWGMAQNAAGLLVLWDGNARILVVDPESGTSWEPETAGLQSGSTGNDDKARKVYSKWSYIPQLDAFFGIANPDLGIVLYRLSGSAPELHRPASTTRDAGTVAGIEQQSSENSSATVPVAAQAQRHATSVQGQSGPAPMEIKASAGWKDVCVTAVLCDPMDKGDVIYRGRVVDSGPPQIKRGWRSISQKNPDLTAPAPDPEIGGLRFTFPSNSGSGDSGNFKTNFSPDYSFQVGPADAGAPAQEVYIQFQVRYSCTFIWTDCDPKSPNYRKERRCFVSKDEDGRCTASKIALISTGDREGSAADACTRIQVALNHRDDHSLSAFHWCPRAIGFTESLPSVGGRSQNNSQPNGLYFCPRILASGSKSGWNASADSCFRLIDDRWITIQVHLLYGPWQPKARKSDPKLSHVSIWAAVEGENGGRQRLVIDNDFAPTTPEHPDDFIGKIWLMPHLFGKSDAEEHPPFYVWYRNLIVSQTIVPNPG